MKLKIENAQGQRYDGASAMTDTKSGVATQVIKRKMSFYILLWTCTESCCWKCYSKFEYSIRDI